MTRPPAVTRRRPPACLLALVGAACAYAAASGAAPGTVTIRKDFEGGSCGRVEALGETTFRCHVAGQSDERGRNRQASWYYFRMDGVKGRDVTLTLTDFVGEYNGKPGAVAMTADTVPVFSYDDETWRHFPAMEWDDAKKEATLKFRPERDTVWVAHVPPYPPRRLRRLLDDVGRSPHVLDEVIGKSVRGRDLHLVTVTNPDVPDRAKKVVWLIARQHAWEAGTSYVLDGALRFITSDRPRARELRDRVVFKFVPTMDPDGCAAGAVRFNANGFDLNRHWDEVDLRRPELLRRMPEIWYVKKAVLGWADAGRPIDLMLNLHNTETVEYLQTADDDPAARALMQLFHDKLAAETTFDPTGPTLRVGTTPDGTTNELFRERKVPVLLMEQRISTGKKLGRRPTADDRLAFGARLIEVMAETVMRSK
jgi:hypothetical protein